MERWNELAAGYVLGNLTEEEQEELSAVLREHPQLKVEIARLRKTATLSRPPISERTKISEKAVSEKAKERLTAGSQGWADTAHVLPGPLPANNEHSSLDESAISKVPDVNVIDGARHLNTKTLNAKTIGSKTLNAKTSSKLATFFTSPWSWLMALLLVGVGLDNWRMRRLLAIAQERIFQLELSSEYEPSNAE